MNTLESLINSYRKFVKECLLNDEIFKKFKQNYHYKQVLEHVTVELGLSYLNIIKKQTPELFNEINKIKINDSIGAAELYNYPEIGEVSPSTLRYCKVLSDILKIFKKKKFNKIAEIGVGYGGQFLIFDQFTEFKDYYFFDLREVLRFSEKYLDNFLIKNCFKTKHLSNYNEKDTFDLVISNYAFSELPSKLQNIYLEKLILSSKRGYMTMNSGKENSVFKGDFLHLDEIKKKMPYIKVINETPNELVHSGNYVIVWEK